MGTRLLLLIELYLNPPGCAKGFEESLAPIGIWGMDARVNIEHARLRSGGCLAYVVSGSVDALLNHF